MGKAGLDWFRIDTAFDDKFELVCAEYGSKGFEVIVRLWQKIYSSGYYLEWSDEVALLFARKYSLGGSVVSDIVKCAVNRGLFDKRLFSSLGILTSHGIQDWYFDCVGRRREVEVVRDYLLVDVTQKLKDVNIKWKNASKNPKNVCNSEHSTVQNSTVQYIGTDTARAREGRSDGPQETEGESDKIDPFMSEFFGKYHFTEYPSGDMEKYDFKALLERFAESEFLRNTYSWGWVVKNYANILAGAYKDFPKRQGKKEGKESKGMSEGLIHNYSSEELADILSGIQKTEFF